jgi:transposase
VQIVEETLSADVSVAVVARRHGVNVNQVFHWRKLCQSGLLVPTAVEVEGVDHNCIGELARIRWTDKSQHGI